MTPTIISQLRHNDNCTKIPHNELLPNDLVWRCGELFRANEIFCYKGDNDQVVIRFEGICLTGSYSGTYGARADVSATIVKRGISLLHNLSNTAI